MFETYVSIQQKVPITVILPESAQEDFQLKIASGLEQSKQKIQELDVDSLVRSLIRLFCGPAGLTHGHIVPTGPFARPAPPKQLARRTRESSRT